MDVDQRVARQIKDLESSRARVRQGVVTGTTPLEVSVAGSETSVAAMGINGDSYSVDDRIAVLQWGKDLLVLGKPNSDPQAGSGGGPWQPLDSDLTAIAALATTSFGRALLTQADAAATRGVIGVVIGSDVQAYDSDLAAIASLTTTSFGRSLLTQANAAAALSTIGAAATSHTHSQSDITGLSAALALLAPLASPALTGNPTAPTQTAGNNSTRVATTAYADGAVATEAAARTAADALKANLASPAFTGNPTAPTPATGDNDTSIATTAFTQTVGDLARLGGAFKPAVYAASIAALPAHTRSGDVLTASANGFLAPSFGDRKFTWFSGSAGSGNGQFNQPYDCAVDSSGNIFVVDSGNNRIQKFNSSGTYQSQFATTGEPSALAFDSSGNFWVLCSSSSEEIQKYNSSGVLQASYNIGGPPLVRGYGIAIDSSNNVWVTTSSNTFEKYNSSGVFQSSFGTYGTGNGQFNQPGALAIDGSNNVFVCDAGNNRVQKFNSSGTYQSQFGTAGSGDGQFQIPSGIAIDSGGNIWVSDYFNARVQKFTSGGTYSAQVGAGGNGNGQFYGPRGIAFNAADDLYATDSGNNRIQKFAGFTLTAGVQGGVLVRLEGGGVHLENGLYDVTNAGSGSTQWVLTRRPDAVNGLLRSGHLVTAQTTNGVEGLAYLLSTPDPITVNTTAIQFDKFQPGGPPTPHSTSHAPGGGDQIEELPFGVLGIHTLDTTFTTTGTHTTMQDEGLNKTVTYQGARRLKITIKVNPNPSGGAPQIVRFQVVRGTSTLVGQWQTRNEVAGVTSETWECFIDGPATGATENFRVQMAAAAGNTACQSFGSANFTRQLVIEDIGPQ